MARKSLKAEVVEVTEPVTTEEVEMNAITENVEAVESVTTTEEVEMNTETVSEVVEVTEPVVTETAETENDSQGLDTLGEAEEVETIEANHPMMRTTFVMTPEEELTQEAWDDIQERLDVLNVESIKLVIDYCKDRLHELQREEIEALEAQMREIQSKLFSMKGVPTISASMNSAPKTTRIAKPIVNPADPRQVYTFGKHPSWLKELVETTGKTIDQLRNGQ